MPIAGSPQIIFPNFVNDVIIARPVAQLGNRLNAASLRMAWHAGPGDTIVLPSRMSPGFWLYLCGILDIPPDSVEIIEADGDGLTFLADVVADRGLTDQARRAAQRRPGTRLVPFALDDSALRFASSVGIGIAPYSGNVPVDAVKLVRDLNTKTGFRELAARLSIPVPEGIYCETRAALATAIPALMPRTGGVVVKPRRSCLGYGLRFLSTADLPNLESVLRTYLSSLCDQPDGWVVEERVRFDKIVTVEMVVDSEGPRVAHTGEMRTPDGSFSGQVTPLRHSASVVEQVEAAGIKLGMYLAERGYAGPFDVDGGISAADTFYATECNIRHTAATYLDHLVRRLLGADASRISWVADARPGEAGTFESGLDLLTSAGLTWKRGRSEGVILVNDTIAFDRKWRYLVMAPSGHRADDIERQVIEILRLATPEVAGPVPEQAE
jgi:hypothetical protein